MEVGAEIKLVSQVPLYALEECLTLRAFINQHLRAWAVLTIARVQLKLRSLCGYMAASVYVCGWERVMES